MVLDVRTILILFVRDPVIFFILSIRFAGKPLNLTGKASSRKFSKKIYLSSHHYFKTPPHYFRTKKAIQRKTVV